MILTLFGKTVSQNQGHQLYIWVIVAVYVKQTLPPPVKRPKRCSLENGRKYKWKMQCINRLTKIVPHDNVCDIIGHLKIHHPKWVNLKSIKYIKNWLAHQFTLRLSWAWVWQCSDTATLKSQQCQFKYKIWFRSSNGFENVTNNKIWLWWLTIAYRFRAKTVAKRSIFSVTIHSILRIIRPIWLTCVNHYLI